jgi:hypothetical protein
MVNARRRHFDYRLDSRSAPVAALPLILGSRRRLVQDPGARVHRLDLAVALLDDGNLHDASSTTKKTVYTVGYLEAAGGGSSRIQGHAFIVLTLPLLFLITEIFIADSLGARRARK